MKHVNDLVWDELILNVFPPVWNQFRTDVGMQVGRFVGRPVGVRITWQVQQPIHLQLAPNFRENHEESI